MEAAGRPKPPGVGFQPRLPVFVSTSSGTLIRIEVADGDSLEAIKSKIQDKAGMPPSRGSARHGKEARLIATEQTLSRPNPEPGTSSTDEGVLSDQTDNVMSLRGPQRMPQEAAIGTGPNSSAVRNGLVDSWEPSGETKFKVQKGGKLSSMTLLVNGLSGKPFTIRVKTGDTAEEIYAKIQDKEGVPHQNDQHHKEELKRGTNMPLTPVPAEQLSFPKPSLVDELQPPEVSSPEVQDQEELQLVEENSMSPRAAGAKQETSASTSRPASDPSLRQNRAAPSPTMPKFLVVPKNSRTSGKFSSWTITGAGAGDKQALENVMPFAQTLMEISEPSQEIQNRPVGCEILPQSDLSVEDIADENDLECTHHVPDAAQAAGSAYNRGLQVSSSPDSLQDRPKLGATHPGEHGSSISGSRRSTYDGFGKLDHFSLQPAIPEGSPRQSLKQAGNKDFPGALQPGKETRLKWQPPSLEKWHEFHQEAHPQHKRHNVWRTPPTCMEEFGAGVVLYFTLLRWIILLLCFLVLLSLPAIFFYTAGNSAVGASPSVTAGMLAGFGPIWDVKKVNVTQADIESLSGRRANLESMSVQAMDGLRIRSLWWNAGDYSTGTPETASFMGSSMKKASALSIIVALDGFAMAIVFLLGCYFQHRLLVMDRDMHNQATIANYSVMVTALPETTAEDDLQLHFRAWGQIHSVHVVHDDAWLYSELVRRGAQVERAEHEVATAVAKVGRHISVRMEDQWNDLAKQLAGELLDMVRKRDDQKAAVAAFVTFESVAQAQACAMSYKGHTNWLRRKLLQPSHFRLESIFPLQVEHAPEPTNVKYSNLQCSWLSWFFRRVWTALAVVSLLVVVWFMAATWLAFLGRAPAEVAGRTEEQCRSALNSTCGAPNVSETVMAVEWAIPAELSSSWWECSVQGLGCDSKFNGCAECFCTYVSDRHEDLCQGTSSGLRVAARRAVVLVMAVVGSSLAAWACIACVRNEAHRTLTSERQAIAAKVSVTLLLSMVILPMLFNVSLPGTTWAMAGWHPDLTPGWYRDAGINLLAAVVVAIAFIALRPVFLLLLIRMRYRRASSAETQEAMNKTGLCPEFGLPARLGMHLAVLMTAIIFCSALPILNIGALLYFAAAYLGDKAELLRLCRMPPIYSTRVLLVAMGGLRWAVVGHLVFAAWAFSIHRTGAADLGDLRGVLSAAYAILPGSLLTPNISSGHFEDRLLQTSAVPYTLVALLVPVVLLARAAVTVSSALLSDIGGCALPSLELGGSNSRVRPSDHPPLSDQQVRAELAGPDTYQNMRTEVVGGSAARRFLLHCLLAADEGQQLGPLHMMCDGAVDPERLGGLLRQPGQMLPRNGSESARLPGKVREMLGNPGGGSSAAVHGNTRAGGPGTKDPLGFTDEDPEAEQKAMLLRNQIGL